MPGFIGLADAKVHVVDPDADDSLIQGLIDGASALVERRTGYVAATREQTFGFDRFGGQLELRLRPIDIDSIAVTYLDANGDQQSFTDLRVIEKNGTTRILPAIGVCWPSPACVAGAVTVTADVGLGATDEDGAPDAPDNLKHAVRLIVASWHLDREGGPIPAAAEQLLGDERARRV